MININRSTFSKTHISFVDQARNIEAMFLADVNKDIKIINSLISIHGFYRLKGYIKPFLRTFAGKKLCYVGIDVIKNIIEIDISLRSYLLDKILKIENMITLKISEKMSLDQGPYWILKDELFTSFTLSERECAQRHEKIVLKVRKDTKIEDGQHPHPGVVSYASKHDPDHLPSWIIREATSFGTWCQIFDAMGNDQRELICKIFNLKKENAKTRFFLTPNSFSSWIRSITILRNTCAHNGLIINKIFSHHPSPNESVPSIKNESGPNLLERIKVIYCFLSHLSLEESQIFIEDLKSILYKYENDNIDESIIYKVLGFNKSNL